MSDGEGSGEGYFLRERNQQTATLDWNQHQHLRRDALGLSAALEKAEKLQPPVT